MQVITFASRSRACCSGDLALSEEVLNGERNWSTCTSFGGSTVNSVRPELLSSQAISKYVPFVFILAIAFYNASHSSKIASAVSIQPLMNHLLRSASSSSLVVGDVFAVGWLPALTTFVCSDVASECLTAAMR